MGQEVSTGVHYWKFKIVKLLLAYNNYTHYFGIWGTKSTGDPMKRFMSCKPAYSFCAGNNWTYGPGASQTKYYVTGRKCKSGDIIEMICDFNKLTLRYKINDKDCGIAFNNIQKCAYRAAVHVQTQQ